MAAVSMAVPRRGARWDALMVVLAVAQALVWLCVPTAAAIALGVWWNSNTISHNFLHRPFFRSREANRLFAAYLSVLLGIPQSLWRDRHLAHHAGMAVRVRCSAELLAQTALVVTLWATIAARAPGFFLRVYVPGYLAGLGLCALHGYYEHARGVTSHYGALYNLLCFNDGYHAEHHAWPGAHWSKLGERRERAARSSRWPAPLRWMESFSLEGLERMVLQSPILQRWVLRCHARAFGELAGEWGTASRVAIVGGGVFPRTALILGELLPAARLTIIDACRANLEQARRMLAGRDIEFVHARYTIEDEGEYDLVVIPLSYQGDREALYARPPAKAVLIHDWIWRRRDEGPVVSVALLKRVNLVSRG